MVSKRQSFSVLLLSEIQRLSIFKFRSVYHQNTGYGDSALPNFGRLVLKQTK